MDPLTSQLTSPALRPYQHQVVTEVYAHIRSGIKRILVVAPTGAGKTVIASQIVADAASRQRRVLFVVHRDILIAQTYDKLSSFGVECGFIKAGWQEQRQARVQIASVQTLLQRDWWAEFAADVVLLDEAHIVAWSAIVQGMMAQIYPQAIYVGLTATPWRLRKRQGMGDIFQALVSAPMPHELIDHGFLVKPAYFGVPEPDLDGVKTVAGDFDEGELAIACDRPELIKQLVAEWKRLAWGRRTIAFAVNVQHSQHIYEAFQQQGIPASHVDGDTPIKVRNRIYQQLAQGDILVLTSCQTLTEGFDVCSVSAILLSRPTKSKALYFQMVGRGLRLSPETYKHDCLVVDQAGNVNRHGFIEDLKGVSLKKGHNREPGETPTKICPRASGGCGAILYTFQMRCPRCGYCFPELEQLPLVQKLEHLLRPEDVERMQFYRQKIQEAYRQGFSPGWAAVIFKEACGYWPPKAWAWGALFGDAPTVVQKETYYEYLRAIAQRKQKPDIWVEHHFGLEFGAQERFLHL